MPRRCSRPRWAQPPAAAARFRGAVFVNGDSFIRNAKALEPVFKARMFAPVEG